MKLHSIILLLTCISFAFAFDINGTNVIFRFENQSLDSATKNMIETDLLRRIAPTLQRASIGLSIIEGNENYELEGVLFCSPTPLSLAHTLDTTLTKESSNFLLRVDDEVVSQYISKIQLYSVNTNAIKQAWDFADYLNNSDIQNMSTNELRNLRLVKGYEPDQTPVDGLEQLKIDFQNSQFYHPSIAEFQMIKCGPNNGTYLWGILPYNKNNRTHAVPIIYINGKWMISFWMYEESLLGM